MWCRRVGARGLLGALSVEKSPRGRTRRGSGPALGGRFAGRRAEEVREPQGPGAQDEVELAADRDQTPATWRVPRRVGKKQGAGSLVGGYVHPPPCQALGRRGQESDGVDSVSQGCKVERSGAHVPAPPAVRPQQSLRLSVPQTPTVFCLRQGPTGCTSERPPASAVGQSVLSRRWRGRPEVISGAGTRAPPAPP